MNTPSTNYQKYTYITFLVGILLTRRNVPVSKTKEITNIITAMVEGRNFSWDSSLTEDILYITTLHHSNKEYIENPQLSFTF